MFGAGIEQILEMGDSMSALTEAVPAVQMKD